jgi:periplasmic protein TonB
MRRSRWVAVVIVIAAHAALLWALMALTMLTEATSATAAQPEARLVVVNIAPRPHATPTPTSSTPPANASPASTTRAPLAPRAKAAPRVAPAPAIAEHFIAPDKAAASAEPVAATSPSQHDGTASPAAPPPTLTVARAAHSQCALAPYPPALKEQGIEGVVQLRILVNSEGRAAEVQMVASSGWRLFDQAALAQARGCRFVPARRGAQPVDDWVEFPMRFALNG